MPTTFDEMVVNLGYHAERKEIRNNITSLAEELQEDLTEVSNSDLRTKIIDIGKHLKKINYINNPYFKNMETVQNELYRKLTKKSLQEEKEK